jgi:hypothetical protein
MRSLDMARVITESNAKKEATALIFGWLKKWNTYNKGLEIQRQQFSFVSYFNMNSKFDTFLRFLAHKGYLYKKDIGIVRTFSRGITGFKENLVKWDSYGQDAYKYFNNVNKYCKENKITVDKFMKDIIAEILEFTAKSGKFKDGKLEWDISEDGVWLKADYKSDAITTPTEYMSFWNLNDLRYMLYHYNDEIVKNVIEELQEES